mgnify:CR=1 FL=1
MCIRDSGCYFGAGRGGWNPGWEVGHGYRESGSDVCIRDADDNQARRGLQYDVGSRPVDLLGVWAHYAFVFDRSAEVGKAIAYINGVQQTDQMDISNVVGSIDNDESFTIGTLYGWKTDGQLDEYRMYNRAVSSSEIGQIYPNMPDMPDGCPPARVVARQGVECPAFLDGMTFFVNSFDINSWTDGTSWDDVSGSNADPAVGTIPGGTDAANHVFKAGQIPSYHEFAGTEHFEFNHPEYFDFPGDFTVSALVRPPDSMGGFAMLLSRRDNSDYTQHHQIFLDTRSTWVGDWTAGNMVAVMYMGGGGADGSPCWCGLRRCHRRSRCCACTPTSFRTCSRSRRCPLDQ